MSSGWMRRRGWRRLGAASCSGYDGGRREPSRTRRHFREGPVVSACAGMTGAFADVTNAKPRYGHRRVRAPLRRPNINVTRAEATRLIITH